jgi:hypothetical protein
MIVNDEFVINVEVNGCDLIYDNITRLERTG